MKLFLFFLLLNSHAFANSDFRARANTQMDEFSPEDVLAEVEVGKNLAARILNYHHLHPNLEAQTYLNSLGSFVISKVGRPEITYYFAILDSNDTNAYAMPGGYIFLTKGVMKNAGSEEALLGVIAHEVGHINERHAVKNLKIRGSSFLFQVGSALGGAQTQSLQKFLETAMGKGLDLLFGKGLSANDEYSADRYAANFLSSIEIHSDSYVNFLSRIKENPQISQNIMRKTHPPLDKRIDQLKLFQKNLENFSKVREQSEKRYKHIRSLL